jgi:hypothetical protein
MKHACSKMRSDPMPAIDDLPDYLPLNTKKDSGSAQ